MSGTFTFKTVIRVDYHGSRPEYHGPFVLVSEDMDSGKFTLLEDNVFCPPEQLLRLYNVSIQSFTVAADRPLGAVYDAWGMEIDPDPEYNPINFWIS